MPEVLKSVLKRASKKGNEDKIKESSDGDKIVPEHIMAFNSKNKTIVPVPISEKNKHVALVESAKDENMAVIEGIYHRENCVFMTRNTLETDGIQVLARKCPETN